MRALIVLACLFLLPAVLVEAKPPKNKKAALKILNSLKQVDGAGSGLDADTVQDMTPAQLQGGRLVVKDSQGALVGVVTELAGDATVRVVRSVNGHAVAFFVSADGFTNDLRVPLPALYYASGDCTGAPLVQENDVTASALLASDSGSAETFDDPSSCPSPLTGRGGCCTTSLVATKTAPAATVDLGSLGLAPPFHLEGP